MKVGNHDHPERFMQAADLFLFPSISEGLGTVVLEALMCGLPVVATLIQGITDQIIQNGRNGFLVDFRAKDLCEFIEKGIVLGDKREEISKMAHAIFNATLIDEKYYKLLQFSKDSVIKNQISAIN
jgi:glycosyltransferase involved in cell wall biosynthesis